MTKFNQKRLDYSKRLDKVSRTSKSEFNPPASSKFGLEIACLSAVAIGATAWFLSKPPALPVEMIPEKRVEVVVKEIIKERIVEVERPVQSLVRLPVQAEREIDNFDPAKEPPSIYEQAMKAEALEPKRPEEDWSIDLQKITPDVQAAMKESMNSAAKDAMLARSAQPMAAKARTYPGGVGNSGAWVFPQRVQKSDDYLRPLSLASSGSFGGSAMAARPPMNAGSANSFSSGTAMSARAVPVSSAMAMISRSPASMTASQNYVLARTDGGKCSLLPPAAHDQQCHAKYPCPVCGGCCCRYEAHRLGF